MSIVLKSENLNFLEPSGPVQASNGITLPLFHQSILQYKTITGELHDQQCLSEQMDGRTHEVRSSDNTVRTFLDAKKHVSFLGLPFLMTS